MSVRKLMTVGAMVSAVALTAYAALTRLRQPPVPEAPSAATTRLEHSAKRSPAIDAVAAAQAGQGSAPLLRVSTDILDFGSTPVSYPSTRAIVLHNGGTGPVRFSDVSVDAPFKALRSSGTVAGGVSEKILVEFNPTSPGVYESRMTVAMAEAPGGAFQVLVKGRAVLTPEQAGAVIPPPPDQLVRKWEQEQAALQLQEAARKAVFNHAKEAAAAAQDEDAPAGAADSAQADADRARGAAAQVPAVFLAAFGQTQNPDTDAEVPVPLPEGDTDPNPEENPLQAEKKEKEKDHSPQFTISSDSSIVVSSAREAIPVQTMTARVTGGTVRLDGRVRFPDISFAFGQSLSVAQWGNITGKLSADGSVEMNMVVRIEDTNHFVFDLPVKLTTNMTVGYSTEGRQIFTVGVPRNPESGAIKLVGIANIPLGAGTSIDEAPVILEVLGWLQI